MLLDYVSLLWPKAIRLIRINDPNKFFRTSLVLHTLIIYTNKTSHVNLSPERGTMLSVHFFITLFCCKNYITIILFISTCWENYSKERLCIILLFTYWFLFIFLFTLEPGSQLSEELWHRVQKGTRCHFRVERRPRCTWSSPLPGVFSLKWEALRLSVEEVQGYSASSDLVVMVAVNQEIRCEFVCRSLTRL